MLTPDELARFISVMRDGGARSVKVDGIEIALDPLPVVAGPAPATGHGRKPLTYSQLLFAATEGLPEEEIEPGSTEH